MSLRFHELSRMKRLMSVVMFDANAHGKDQRYISFKFKTLLVYISCMYFTWVLCASCSLVIKRMTLIEEQEIMDKTSLRHIAV